MDALYPDPPTGFTASSQASRFHTSASVSSSNAIDIHDIQLAVPTKDLLVDAHLQLTPGSRYGLIGRNGVGKSLLLKSIAFHWLPGVPRKCRTYYIDQVEERSDDLDAVVVDWVMKADVGESQRLDEIRELEAAIASDDSAVMKAALGASQHSQLLKEVLSAREVAARTSGVRGVIFNASFFKIK